MIVEAAQGDRVDLLVWSKTGRDKDLVEQVVDHNPGLADVMYDLPVGYTFEIPDYLTIQQTPKMKRLW